MRRLAPLLLAAPLVAGCGGDTPVAQALPATLVDRGADPFVFRTEPLDAYVRVDRMGAAAVATLVLPAGATRDQFNAGEPADDGDYAGAIVPRLRKIHFELDDDLAASGLSPCEVSHCLQQVVPVIVPDVIRLRLAQPDAFPNGRTLADPVVDRLVALALLDFAADCGDAACSVSTFEQVPLNPAANELPLPAAFPYLALPHPPPP